MELGITFSQLNYMSQELKKSIGDHKVLISTRIPYIYPEVFYFVGNLNPAETRYERLGLQVSEDVAELDRTFLKNNSSDIKFIVTLTNDDDIEILSQELNLNYLFFRNVATSNLSLSVYKVNQ
jgi:hypothetical protein